jgi:hypothetical protein
VLGRSPLRPRGSFTWAAATRVLRARLTHKALSALLIPLRNTRAPWGHTFALLFGAPKERRCDHWPGARRWVKAFFSYEERSSDPTAPLGFGSPAEPAASSPA